MADAPRIPVSPKMEKANERSREVIAEVNHSMEKETDRGLALVGAAILDTALYDLLCIVFIDDNRAKRELLVGGPLGTMASRTALCYALGLISKHARDQLEVIRRIRNRFAHAHAPLDFGDEKVKQQVSCLYGGLISKRPLPNSPLPNPSPRERFTLAMLSAYQNLYGLRIGVKGIVNWPSSYELSLTTEKEYRAVEEWIARVQRGEEASPRIWYDWYDSTDDQN